MNKKRCKICFESAKKRRPLISPCLCKGSMAYVHEDCLQKWYSMEPERGLKCSVCLEELATYSLIKLESIRSDFREMDIFLYYRPYFIFSVINLSHLLISQGYNLSLALIYQTGIHILYYNFIRNVIDIENIHDKKKYMSLWLVGYRPWFFIFHAILLSFYSISYPISCIAENFFMTFYIQIHYEILTEMNSSNRGIRFTNRPSVPS